MLFIGHFEAISIDKQFKNDHEKEIRLCCKKFHNWYEITAIMDEMFEDRYLTVLGQCD